MGATPWQQRSGGACALCWMSVCADALLFEAWNRAGWAFYVATVNFRKDLGAERKAHREARDTRGGGG